MRNYYKIRVRELEAERDAALAQCASTAKLAAASECLAELQTLVQSATVEVDRLRAVVVEQEAQLEIWERQLWVLAFNLSEDERTKSLYGKGDAWRSCKLW